MFSQYSTVGLQENIRFIVRTPEFGQINTMQNENDLRNRPRTVLVRSGKSINSLPLSARLENLALDLARGLVFTCVSWTKAPSLIFREGIEVPLYDGKTSLAISVSS